MNRKSVFRTLSVLGLLVTTLAAPARAEKIQRSATECRVAPSSNIGNSTQFTAGSDQAADPNGFGQMTNGAVNSDVFGIAIVMCPADRFDTISVGSLTLDAYKNASDGVKAKACVAFRGGFGGICGSVDSNTSMNVQPISIPVTAWAGFPSDYRFILVTMQRAFVSGTLGNRNAIFGYRQN